MTHGILTEFFFFENMSTLVQKESQRYKQTLKNWWHFFIPFIPMINYLKWNYAFTYTYLLEIKQEKKPPTMIHNWIFHFYAHPTSLFLMARQFSDCSFKLLWYQWNTWKIEIIISVARCPLFHFKIIIHYQYQGLPIQADPCSSLWLGPSRCQSCCLPRSP